MAEEGDSSFLGPSYEYWKNIKQPGQMGMSPAFTLDALSADVTGLLSYVEVLVTGSGNASKTGKPLGNKFFLKTNGKCRELTIEKWKKEIAKYAVANISKAENLRTGYRSWNKTLNVDFDISVKAGDFPAEPEKDFEVIHSHQYKEMKEDITNALTILKMTDEETVNASTMKQIAKYL